MPFTGKVGDTLHLSDDGGGHRYVIITPPNSNGNVVIVNFTYKGYWKEWLVTFRPKDNKRLFSKKTTVNYADARIVPVQTLIDIAETAPSNDYVFCHHYHSKEIAIGALKSQFTPVEVLEELQVHYPDEYAKYVTT